MSSRSLLGLTLFSVAVTVLATDLGQLPPASPPQAKTGECWALVKTPPEYTLREIEVELKPATTVERRIPGEFRWEEREVRVPSFEQRRVVKDAVVEWVEEAVTEPARTETRRLPGTYRSVMRDIPIREAGAPQWKQDITADGALCWVETTTEFKRVSQRQLVTPGRVETIEIPERTRTVRRKVVVEPAQIETTTVPARMKVERIRVAVTPDQFVTETVPAVMGIEHRRVMTTPSKLDWRAVLCDTNATPQKVRAVQQALTTRGHYRGPVDGVFGRQTLMAITAFQTAEGLATDGVTLEALAALGVN